MNAPLLSLKRSLPLLATLLLACCTTARAVEVVQIAPPTVVTVRLDTGALIYDIAWSDHRNEAMDELCGSIIRELENQRGYYLIDLPQLQPTWDSKAMRQRTNVIDLNGDLIRRRDLSKGRGKYAKIYEECIDAIADRIRDARPDIHFAFVGLEPATDSRGNGKNYTDFSSHVPGFHISTPIAWMGNEAWLSNSIRRALPKQSVWMLADSGATFSFQTTDGTWYISSFEEIEVEHLDELLPAVDSGPAMTSDSSSNSSPPLPTFTSSGPTSSDDESDDPAPVGTGGESAPNNPPSGGVPPLPGSNPPPPMDPAPNPNQIIEFPPRADVPYASEHGRVRLGEIEVLPARYQRKTTPFVGIQLSSAGQVRANNPRGWLQRYSDLPSVGFDSPNLEADMQALHALGIREVWFWEWSGHHSDGPGDLDDVMAWFTPEAHTPIMQSTWPQFVNRWKSRGMRFGFWLGGISWPNEGTADEPNHVPLNRGQFGMIADDIAAIRALGFDAVGLDAFSWALSQLDMPEWASWRANEHGERDRGLCLALQRMLNSDPRIAGMHICTETRVPWGTHLAETPTFKSAASRTDNRSTTRPNIDTLEPPDFEDIVNPGHEIIMFLMGEGSGNWTLTEFTQMMNKIREYGYRPALNIQVLRDLDAINHRGDVLIDLSDILNP